MPKILILVCMQPSSGVSKHYNMLRYSWTWRIYQAVQSTVDPQAQGYNILEIGSWWVQLKIIHVTVSICLFNMEDGRHLAALAPSPSFIVLFVPIFFCCCRENWQGRNNNHIQCLLSLNLGQALHLAPCSHPHAEKIRKCFKTSKTKF